MNKQEFMNILQSRLANVNPSWRDDILSDLEEHFINALAAGTSEEEIIHHLGDPMELAQQFYEEAALAGQIMTIFSNGPSSDLTASMNRRANDRTRRPESTLRKTIINVDHDDTPETPPPTEEQESPNVSTYTTQESFENPFEDTATSSAEDFFSAWGRDFSKGFSKAFDGKSFSKSMRSIFDGLASSLGSLNFNFSTPVSHETETLTFLPEDNIKILRVNVASPNIIITESEDDNTYVQFDKDIQGLTVQCSSGTLQINQFNTIQTNHNHDTSIEIRLPDIQPVLDLSSTLGDIKLNDLNPDCLRLKSTTGDITVNTRTCYGDVHISSIEDIDITIDDIYGEAIFQSTNGDMELYIEHSDNLQAKTVSGDISLDSKKLESAAVSSVSGDLELNIQSCLGEITATSISGDIFAKIGTCASNVTLKSTSGDVEGNITSLGGNLRSTRISGDIPICPQDIQGNIEIRSNSGSVELTTPSLDSFSVELRSRSGDIDGDLPAGYSNGHHHHFGYGSQQLSIITISGDITLN